MRLYLPIILSYTFILALLTSTTFSNLTYAQVSPTQGTPSPAKLHLVKIMSPTKGQQVPVGKDLAVSGTSASNNTAGCGVSVKVNSISPYHNASALGVGGKSDYSKWNFTLTSAYTTIKPGQNKITAKFACANNPTLLSHYSVNVTGVNNAATNVGTNGTTKSGSQQHQVSSVTTPGLNSTTAAAGAASSSSSNPSSTINTAPVTTSNSSYTRSPVTSAATFAPSGNNNNASLGTLFVSVNVGKNTLHPGDKQTLTTFVADKANSSKSIAGALVSGSIASPSGAYKKLDGTTDDQGKASYSWNVSKTGTYKVLIDVSAPNYENYSTSKAFKVISVSTSSSDSSSSDSSVSHSTSENTNDNHKNHVSTTSTATTTETSTSGNTKGNNHSHHDSIHIGNNGHHHKPGWGSNNNNIDPNVNGLAQKIINNVKNKLRMQGIFLP